ncbi:hypothetical protein H4R33_005787 [Dimargaris cristalligena]|nr:hypothetical protein H4R33_005787 [Dimargaris cristalligena]
MQALRRNTLGLVALSLALDHSVQFGMASNPLDTSNSKQNEAIFPMELFQNIIDKAYDPQIRHQLLSTSKSFHEITGNNPKEKFEKKNWQFVNPKTMDPRDLATDLPLLVLVDNPPRGMGAVEILKNFLDPSMETLGRRFMSEVSEMPATTSTAISSSSQPSDRSPGFSPLSHVLQTMFRFMADQAQADGISMFYSELLHNTAGMIMARLATTDRFDRLQQFMDDLALLRKDPDWRKRSIYTPMEGQLAVVLAALGQNIALLESLPGLFPGMPWAEPQTKDIASKCILAEFMRNKGFVRGAEFVEKALGCAALAIQEGFKQEVLSVYCKLDLYLQNLRLTDSDDQGKFQMEIAVVTPEFGTGQQKPSVDTTPKTFDTEFWGFDAYLNDPNFHRYVRQGAYLQSLGQLPSKLSIAEHAILRGQVNVPEEF